MPGFPRTISIVLLVLTFVFSVYRAKTQSYTVDEAYAFRRFVDKDVSVMAKEYDACNHVLHTLLTKVFHRTFGISELELRLSSLLACLLYLIAAYKLSLLCFGTRWTHVLSVALLTLHPLVLDFFVASRGYGLGLALLLWALYCACCYWLKGKDTKWLSRAGVLAGLAIAANLTMLVPAAALGGTMLVMAVRKRLAGLWTVVDNYGGPAVVIAFLFLVLPLLRSGRENFYYGAQTFREGMHFLLQPGLVKVTDRWPLVPLEAAVPLLERAVLPLMFFALLLGLAAAAHLFVRGPEPEPFRLAPYVLFAGTLVGSALLIWIGRWFGVPYPLGRTGMYLIPLFSLALVYGGKAAAWTRLARLRPTAYVAASLMVFVYVTQIDARYFAEWRYDASTARLLRRIQDDVRDRWRERRQPVIGVSSILDNTVEYYRVRRKLHWMGPLTSQFDSTPADYYLLVEEQRPLVDKLGLQVLQVDPVSRAVAARRRQ